MESSTIVGAERKKRTKSTIVLIVLALLIITAFVVSMNTGFTKLSPLEVLRTLFGGGTAKQELILFEFRLPRIVISVLVGAGLALSGCILQGVSRNALADPGSSGLMQVLVWSSCYLFPFSRQRQQRQYFFCQFWP